MDDRNIKIMDPKLSEQPEPFRVVGYTFEAALELDAAERGAYWQGKEFPPFDTAEYEKIGGGPAEIGVWTHEGGRMIYVFGYVVPEIGYVPEAMQGVTIPGGTFLVFRAPEHKSTEELGENMRAVWRYASEVWLPASEYASDTERMAFEYYLGSDAMVYIPVKPKADR